MILLAELRSVARALGLTDSLIEKDYVLGWLLKGLSEHETLSDFLVFKGGTALRKVYFHDYRLSEDLDFTARQPFTDDELREWLSQILAGVAEQSGIEFHLAEFKKLLADQRGMAWEAKIGYVGPRNQRGLPARIKMDVTSYETILLPTKARPIHHPYSDRFTASLQTYCLEEIAAEKLRTILQRGFPRDVFDTWYILTQSHAPVDRKQVAETFQRKCTAKQVTFTGLADFRNALSRSVLDQHWAASIQKFMRDVPPVGRTRQELLETLGQLFQNGRKTPL